MPIVKNHFKNGKGGPRVVGAGLYVWLYNDKKIENNKAVILYKVEQGVVDAGRFLRESTHEFKKSEDALAMFRELRQTIQKLSRIGKQVSAWPDMVF